jgi:probable F420-dependent oxidoreductase
VKFGTRLYGIEPDAVVAKAVHAEELGFESLWRGDHLLLPDRVSSTYPHAAGGAAPFSPSAPLLDVLTLLAYVAHATTTIRLGTGIFVLPLRDPVAVARSVQTLDILSGGRAMLGVGVGWLAEEFELVGKDFRTRGSVTNEAIAVLKTLWTDPAPAFEGRHFRLAGARFEPKPVQRPHPPILAGGESEAALRRAASLCDGWYGHRPAPEEAAAVVARLRALREEHGRADAPFEVTIRVRPTVSRDDVRRFEEAGVDRVVAEIGALEDVRALEEDVELMERFAERVIDGF